MKWTVQLTRKAAKQTRDLHENVLLVLQLLVGDLEKKGPVPGKSWHNYSKLRGRKQEDKRHCHLIKGNSTYVCCWQVHKSEKYIEVYYVGTHEKAPC